ncbi:MAG: RIP metalloprotease RseP [Xanthomonadales bacterium]|nr:RIP metalloprotease RseP [Xanthomonadales bacterium]
MSAFFGSIWWLIVTLGLLVTFHEYGHFVVARRFGVKVLRFSVGFGKPLWSRRDRHGTEFAVAAIPLGGYVKMLDEREGEVAPEELDRSFNRKPVGVRMAIAAAGPAFNLIFTVLAFWLMFVVGKPDYQPIIGHVGGMAAAAGFQAGDRILDVGTQRVETWTDASMALVEGAIERRDLKVTVADAGGTERVRTLALSSIPAGVDEAAAFRDIGLLPKQWALPPVIGSVQAGSAAAAAGLEPGDRLLSIDATPIGDWREVPPAIQRHAVEGHALAIEVRRGGEVIQLAATPTRNSEAGAAAGWVLGIGPEAVEAKYDALLQYGALAAVPRAFTETWERTRQTLDMLWNMLSGRASLKNLSGVITIAQVANSSADLGVAWFLNFLAIISLSLAILNLLPIPILDGGHLLYYLIELVKGSPVSERVQIAGQYVGLTLLMALMGLALYNDILRIAS